MKKITQKEIEIVKEELAAKRKEFESINFSSLGKKLKWIRNFFNFYVPELEKRYMNEGDFEKWKFLPDELRIQFYLYFPEHGLNMVNYAQMLEEQLEIAEKDVRYERTLGREIRRMNRQKYEDESCFVDRIYFRHND